MSLFEKMFGTYSDRQVKKIDSIAKKVEDLSEKYQAMDNDALKATTNILKDRLKNGETLDDILPDAFAAVREASVRVSGKRPFHSQILGGIVIHQGRIAEMKTGEGKTLMAALPAYLNALTGEGVHIVTVNDYLAKYHSELMGNIYHFLGLTVGLVINGLTPDQRKVAYAADITYGTNNELGFDYLRDNMVIYKENLVQRGHVFAIVDEVDSILIDEARTPLIISGQGEESSDMYRKADDFVRKLKCYRIKEFDAKKSDEDIEEDYIVDEKAKSAVLSAKGIKKAEVHFGVDNIGDSENIELMHYLNNALHARGVKQLDVDYVIKDGKVIIVDPFTGRVMPGRRYSNGLHQAIEAKEGVEVGKENKTQATITFQNYFRMYKKLSGMTGTALTEEPEFREIYSLDVVEIPTNKPMIRKDNNDLVYRNFEGKYRAIVNQIKECNEKGQPVLVGTVSIEKSEYLSRLLDKEGVKHCVLNAKFHEKEAEIVAQAGRLGSITISTNMAGRGTDIMLGGNSEFLAKTQMRKEGFDDYLIYESTNFGISDDEQIMNARNRFKELEASFNADIKKEAELVRNAGGLFILGTERHESRRIDNQLRGRAGRQGDPGESRFFISMQDDLMRLFGSDRILGIVDALKMPEDQPIDARMLSSSIESAQKRIEGQNFERRKNVLQYDDVMNKQRELIYKQRREVLDGADLKDTLWKMVTDYINGVVSSHTEGDVPDNWDFDGLRSELGGILCNKDDFHYTQEQMGSLNQEDIVNTLTERAEKKYAEQEELFTPEVFREVERAILLRTVDRKWVDHIDAMDDLQGSVGLNAYAQRNPFVEYKIQGGAMFEDMIASIREEAIRILLTVIPKKKIQREQVLTGNASLKGEEGKKVKPTPQRKPVKAGPNDLCPCGSGKKYKKCCGSVGATDTTTKK